MIFKTLGPEGSFDQSRGNMRRRRVWSVIAVLLALALLRYWLLSNCDSVKASVGTAWKPTRDRSMKSVFDVILSALDASETMETGTDAIVGNLSLLNRTAMWHFNLRNRRRISVLSGRVKMEAKKTTKMLPQLWGLVEHTKTYSTANAVVTMVYEYYSVIKGYVPRTIYKATKEYLKTEENMPEAERRGPRVVVPLVGSWNDPLVTGRFDEQFKAVTHRWNYNFAKLNNVSQILTQTILLEYIRIQNVVLKLMDLQMMLVFNDDPQKYPTILDVIQTLCTKDKELLFELKRNVTRRGMKQLLRHMYGMKSWVEIKEKEMLEKFKNGTFFNFSVIFFSSRSPGGMQICKSAVRVFVNDTNWFNAAHFPDDPDQCLILAQVLLNENSMHYLNHGDGCHAVAKELAMRTKSPMIMSFPSFYLPYKNDTDNRDTHIYLGQEDVMLGPTTTAGFFETQDKIRTDFGVIILNIKKKYLIGKSGNLKTTSKFVKYRLENRTIRDYFYDPHNYGFCYGTMFLLDSKTLENLMDRAKGTTLDTSQN